MCACERKAGLSIGLEFGAGKFGFVEGHGVSIVRVDELQHAAHEVFLLGIVVTRSQTEWRKEATLGRGRIQLLVTSVDRQCTRAEIIMDGTEGRSNLHKTPNARLRERSAEFRKRPCSCHDVVGDDVDYSKSVEVFSSESHAFERCAADEAGGAKFVVEHGREGCWEGGAELDLEGV
jgi:hypothetical protein